MNKGEDLTLKEILERRLTRTQKTVVNEYKKEIAQLKKDFYKYKNDYSEEADKICASISKRLNFLERLRSAEYESNDILNYKDSIEANLKVETFNRDSQYKELEARLKVLEAERK
ncbi:MAG: hypothetical protein ACRCYA_00325 [Cetobacterium sp.]|uniref:hypothetical protein n=1 Tax=Cetobacterium sp. TaxID=2071632 RepID=UPI003F370455